MKDSESPKTQVDPKYFLNSEIGFVARGGETRFSEFGVHAKSENGAVIVRSWRIRAYTQEKQSKERRMGFQDYLKVWQEVVEHGALDLADSSECPLTCMSTYEVMLRKENATNRFYVVAPSGRYAAVIEAIERLSKDDLEKL